MTNGWKFGTMLLGICTMRLISGICFILCMARAAQAVPSLFEEPFDSVLKPGWSWIREVPAAWRIVPHALEIKIQPGNMWGPENSGKNILVRELPKTAGPLDICVTVQHSPTGQYEQCDLVLYWDDSHMVKIGEELVDGKLSVVMGREENDKTRTLAIIPLSTNRVELKLRVDANDVTGSFRPAGSLAWSKAGTCDFPAAAKPRAAIQCYQGVPGKEHWARIEHFQISAAAREQ